MAYLFIETEEKNFQPSGYTSSESTSKSLKSKQKRKHSKKKSSSSSVSMNKYTIEKEMESKIREEQYIMFNQDLKRLSSENKSNKKQTDTNKHEISETQKTLQDLQALNKSNIEYNAKTKKALVKMALDKEAASEQNESDRKET